MNGYFQTGKKVESDVFSSAVSQVKEVVQRQTRSVSRWFADREAEPDRTCFPHLSICFVVSLQVWVYHLRKVVDRHPHGSPLGLGI